jgi:hypothetical protein
MAILAAIASGVVLAACTGLRAFLPLFAAGVASRALSWELAPSMQWLASDPALITLGVASLAEVIADKVPVVDHALDAVHTVVAPVAGALAGLSVWLNFPAPIAVALLAGGVHLVAAGTRLKSTAVSAGTLNPAVSVAEDVATLSGIVLAVLAPLVALIVLVVGLTLLVRRRRRRRAADATR